jgi:hypothetical protein
LLSEVVQHRFGGASLFKIIPEMFHVKHFGKVWGKNPTKQKRRSLGMA